LCCLLALTTQKTSHAFFIVACWPITAELHSDAEMCLPLRCVATQRCIYLCVALATFVMRTL
jgi:hypothetical protein